MRKLFFLVLFFLPIVNLAAQTNNRIIDEVIWIIGDEAIFKSDVENEVLRAAYDGRKLEGNPYCVIPEQIAIQKLFLHQAMVDSLSVNDSQVNNILDQQMNYIITNIGSKEKVEEYFHKSLNELREDYREMIKNNNLIQQMQEKLVGTIKVTPSDIKRHFNALPADSVPTVPAQVELQILSVHPPIPQSEINRVKDKLRELTERINANPNDFGMLARLYSEDDVSAKQGGEIGFLGRGQLDPAYADAAFNLSDTKKVSRIVQSEYGYHIIQLIEKRGDKVNTRHILLKPHVSIEDKTNGISRLDSVADKIRENKITFEQAVSAISQDKNTAMNAGLMNNPNTGTSKFEYQDLPPEVAKVVYNMNTGEVSKAFSMIDKASGKEMVAIVKVKSKIPTHKANLTDDYQMLKNILESQRKQELINNWIAQKQKETYISIDPKWRECNFQYKGWLKK